MDWWNWETSYYIPFSSGLPENQKTILKENYDLNSIHLKIKSIVDRYKNGVIITKKNSPLFNALNRVESKYEYNFLKKKYNLDPIFENESIICFKYSP